MELLLLDELQLEVTVLPLEGLHSVEGVRQLLPLDGLQL